MKKIILATMIAVFLILEGSGCGMAKPVSAQEKIISVMKEKYGEEFEFEGWAHKQYGSRDEVLPTLFTRESCGRCANGLEGGVC